MRHKREIQSDCSHAVEQEHRDLGVISKGLERFDALFHSTLHVCSEAHEDAFRSLFPVIRPVQRLCDGVANTVDRFDEVRKDNTLARPPHCTETTGPHPARRPFHAVPHALHNVARPPRFVDRKRVEEAVGAEPREQQGHLGADGVDPVGVPLHLRILH